jgi:hypothetical protein
MRFDLGVLEHLQQPDGDDGAGGTRHSDDDPPWF